MAVDHPIAGVVGYELYAAGLGYADEDGVSGPPSGFGDSSSFGAGDVEGVSVHVHWVMIHAEVDEADADAIAEADDERSIGGTSFAVQEEPVVFHAHCVGNGAVGEDGVFLEVDQEVLVAVGLEGCLRVHDESAKHSGHLLHRHVGVIEVGSLLVDVELVDEASSGLYGRLADGWLSVVADVVLESVPVNGAWFGKMVVEDDSDVIAFVDLNGWSGSAAVEAPKVEGFAWKDVLLYGFGDEMEDFGVSVHCVGKIANIGGDYGKIARGRNVSFCGLLDLAGEIASCEEACADAECSLDESATVAHKNAPRLGREEGTAFFVTKVETWRGLPFFRRSERGTRFGGLRLEV